MEKSSSPIPNSPSQADVQTTNTTTQPTDTAPIIQLPIQQPQNSSTTSSQQIELVTIKPKRNHIIIIGLIIVALVLAASGHYFSQNHFTASNHEKPNLQPSSTAVSPTPISTPKLSSVIIEDGYTLHEDGNLTVYSNLIYGFSFSYPEIFHVYDHSGDTAYSTFKLQLSDNDADHTLVMSVPLIGDEMMCFEYGEIKSLNVAGIITQSADAIGGQGRCSSDRGSDWGNTYVLIPIKDIDGQSIFITYYYPLSDILDAKANLEQIISSFKFDESIIVPS